MDGEVKLPETIWLIWSKRHEGIYPHNGTIRYAHTTELDALIGIKVICKNSNLKPSDLIPVEVRITPVQEVGS